MLELFFLKSVCNENRQSMRSAWPMQNASFLLSKIKLMDSSEFCQKLFVFILHKGKSKTVCMRGHESSPSDCGNFQLCRKCIFHDPKAREWVRNPQADGMMGLLRRAWFYKPSREINANYREISEKPLYPAGRANSQLHLQPGRQQGEIEEQHQPPGDGQGSTEEEEESLSELKSGKGWTQRQQFSL